MGRGTGEGEQKKCKRKLDLLEIIQSLNSTMKVTWLIQVGSGVLTGSATKNHAVFDSVGSGARLPMLESHPSHPSSFVVWGKSLKFIVL